MSNIDSLSRLLDSYTKMQFSLVVTRSHPATHYYIQTIKKGDEYFFSGSI